jgi:hypothetical protein
VALGRSGGVCGTGSGRVLRQQHSTSYGLVCSEEIRMALWDR